MNISDGWRPLKGQRDYFGQESPDRIYDCTDYDYNIVLEDRIREVAEQITAYLKATDRMAKTIVFCTDENAAERMRKALAQLNEDMLKKSPNYVVRITGSDAYGKSKLSYFISVRERFPVIATTSELLSTGVDAKMTNIKTPHLIQFQTRVQTSEVPATRASEVFCCLAVAPFCQWGSVAAEADC